MKNLFFFALVMLAFACNPDKETRVSVSTPQFETTQQSMLFFKNVRGMYYDLEDNKRAGMLIYRFKDRQMDTTQAAVNVALMNNWRNELAYVFIEPTPALKSQYQDTLRIVWQDTLGTQAGTYRFAKGNREAHFGFATQLYNSILDGHKLTFMDTSGVEKPLFESEEFREAFRITMIDYYRIVKIY